MMLEDFLSRPIAFNRAFVTLTGSVNAALMLSQALYWSNRSTTADGWFYKTQQDWEEETGLTRYEQEGARKLLLKAGIWHEERRGVPAKMFFKVDKKAILARFLQNAENPQTEAFSLQETPTPECGISPIIIINKTTTETTGHGIILFKDRPNVDQLIIDMLNEVKARYGIKGESRWTKERSAMIKARLKDWKGESPAKEIKAMIEHRCRVWKGTEWEKFIRIETLFQPKKFFAYMEEAEAAPDKDWTEHVTREQSDYEDHVTPNMTSNNDKYSGQW